MTDKPVLESAEWWEARKKILGGIAAQSRKRGVQWTEAQVKRSENAMLCALGDEDGTAAYQRNGFTQEQWFKKHFPLAAAGAAVTPYARMAQLRKFVGDF